MQLIIGACLVYLLTTPCCDGHLLRKIHVPTAVGPPSLTTSTPQGTTPSYSTQSPVEETGCDFNQQAVCFNKLADATSSIYASASDKNAYAQNLCGEFQQAVTCLEIITPSCSAAASVMNVTRFQFQGYCRFEGSCRLAEPMFCFSGLNEPATDHPKTVCQNLHRVTSCVDGFLSSRGCTPQNTASRFWAYLLTSLEPVCFSLPSSNPPCDLPFDVNMCQNSFNLALVQSFQTGEFSQLCRELDSMKTCLRGITQNNAVCDEAMVLIERLISLSDRVIFGACTSPSCSSNNNVYTVVPNTDCAKFTQSVNGYVAGTHSCPEGTRFDTSVCVCNYTNRVQCNI